jgi:hypothetical protein
LIHESHISERVRTIANEAAMWRLSDKLIYQKRLVAAALVGTGKFQLARTNVLVFFRWLAQRGIDLRNS